MEDQSLKDLFHLIKQVLPEPQELLTLAPGKSVAEALSLMHERNFSQVPVVAGNEVLGTFSYKSFSERVTKLPQNTPDFLDLPVEEFLDDLKFARITDQLTQFIDEFELKDAVLVGSDDRLQGIITTIDVLRYFYQVASPYFMLREIELAIRALMKASVSEEDMKDCIDKSLKKYYEGNNQQIPECLDELTLNDCVMILRYGDTWDYFMSAFGKPRKLVYTRIDQLPQLRNDVFHFKRDITVNEYDYLKDTRNWLLKRITIHEANRREIHQ